jgi:hypothetical protein
MTSTYGLTLHRRSRFTVGGVDITLLYFEDCPNWKTTAERLTLLAPERSEMTVTHHLVETLEHAERAGFLGSPSIQVECVDVFAGRGSRVGLTCRRYPTPDGYGARTLELRVVVADA